MSTSYADISYYLIDGLRAALVGVGVPVYKTVPKTPPSSYVLVHGVIQTEDGTKDDFIYRGTVQVRAVVEGQQTADKKVAQDLLQSIRNTLKPSKAAVFPIPPYELIAFTPESLTELEEQTDNGIKISLIDIYNFIIQ